MRHSLGGAAAQPQQAEGQDGADLAKVRRQVEVGGGRRGPHPQHLPAPLLDADVIGLGGNRDAAAPFLDTVTVAGSAVVPVDLVNIGHWLRLLLGPPTTTGTAPNFTHAFGSGAATLPSNSVEVGYPDVPSFDLCTGVRADTLEVDFSPSGAATATFGLMGQGSLRSATSAGGTPTTTAYTAFNKAQGSISRGGSALAQVTGAKLAFSNGVETVRTIRADRKVEGQDPGIARATGQVTVRFADTVLLNQAQNAQSAAFDFACAIAPTAASPSPCTRPTWRWPRRRSRARAESRSPSIRAAFNTAATRMMTAALKNQQAAAEYA